MLLPISVVDKILTQFWGFSKATSQQSHFCKDKHIFLKSAVTDILNLPRGAGTC